MYSLSDICSAMLLFYMIYICDAFIATVESETETETRNSGKKRQARFFPSDAAEGVQPGGSYNRIAHRGLRMQRGWEVSDRWDGLRWSQMGLRWVSDWLRRDSDSLRWVADE